MPTSKRWINDPQIRPYMLTIRPFDDQGQQHWFETLDRRTVPTSLIFAIVLNEANRFIGTTGFVQIDWLNRNAETGSLIGEKDCWGQGYGTEAKHLLLEYGFDTLGLHRVNSRTFAYNERSARHLIRNGFREEGRLKQGVFRQGRFHDILLYGLLAADWRASQKPASPGSP